MSADEARARARRPTTPWADAFGDPATALDVFETEGRLCESFSRPRLALFFFLFAALVWAGLYVWMDASKQAARRW